MTHDYENLRALALDKQVDEAVAVGCYGACPSCGQSLADGVWDCRCGWAASDAVRRAAYSIATGKDMP